MPSSNAILLACATLTALGLVEPAGRSGTTGAAGAQLRSGSVKELAIGKLLVAARGLPDPNFAETVILLAEHSKEGSMGLIINRRTDVSLARVFPNMKPSHGPPSPLYVGGPVSPDGVLALLRSTAPKADRRRVLDDVFMVATPEGLEESLSAGTAQDHFRVYLGYAGWGPGQLERETLHGSWHVFQADTAVVFDPDPETLWKRQIRRTEERMARLRLPASARQAQPGSILPVTLPPDRCVRPARPAAMPPARRRPPSPAQQPPEWWDRAARGQRAVPRQSATPRR